jgi:predicted DNA-binding antitoxin AbrB/MazE fold protein
MSHPIEAVFENGIFRPLQPVYLQEQQRVTLVLSEPENGSDAAEAEMDQPVGYQPLPLQDCQTIRVKIKHAGNYGPIPYPIQIFSLPLAYLRRHAANLGSRWRLQSPFREHFSQSFARFFMRVGLPAAIPPFK